MFRTSVYKLAGLTVPPVSLGYEAGALEDPFLTAEDSSDEDETLTMAMPLSAGGSQPQ